MMLKEGQNAEGIGMTDWLESEEFYLAMQGYRCAPMEDHREVMAHFENVKRLIRRRVGRPGGRDILVAERNHLRECYFRAVKILTGIHALLYPPKFTNSDGLTFEFHSPMVHEQMQMLSDRIRALPDEIAAADEAMKAGLRQQSANSPK